MSVERPNNSATWPAVKPFSLKSGYDYADEFEFGLDLILDALDGLRSTT